MEEITEDEHELIIYSLYNYLNGLNSKLLSKDLGDIERKNYLSDTVKCKDLILKLKQLNDK